MYKYTQTLYHGRTHWYDQYLHGRLNSDTSATMQT